MRRLKNARNENEKKNEKMKELSKKKEQQYHTSPLALSISNRSTTNIILYSCVSFLDIPTVEVRKNKLRIKRRS